MGAYIKVERIQGKWVCHLQGAGGVGLYTGAANKAQDLKEALDKEPEIHARAERIILNGKKVWATMIGGTMVDSFGSRANKADDLAAAINAVARPVHATDDSLPHQQPEDEPTTGAPWDGGRLG